MAWSAIAGLLSLMIMPVPPAAPALATAPAGHLCSLSPAAPAPGAPETPADRHGAQECAFCTAHPGFSLPAPDAAPLPLRPFAGPARPVLPRAAVTTPFHQFLTGQRPRAPPWL